MTLITFVNGMPLLRGGAVATSAGCCCDGCSGPCDNTSDCSPGCECVGGECKKPCPPSDYYRDGEPVLYGPEYRTYSYFDTIPPAPDFCDCPCQNGTCIEPFIFGPTTGCEDPDNPCVQASACCGQELSCYIRSSDFTVSSWCRARATVFDGSTLDDWGTISGASETITLTDRCLESPWSDIYGVLPPTGGRVSGNRTLAPIVVENGDGTVYLRLNIVARNGIACGPYGASSINVVWYFE